MNDWPKVDLLASAWTTAGNAKPMTENEESPYDLRSRIEAAAGAGYRGFGIVHADLAAARRQMGLRALRAMLEDSGIVHIEVEMLGDWFATGERRRRSDAIRRDLLEAAQVLGARHIKVGGEIHGHPRPFEKMASDFHDLCRDTANVGSRIAFEIMPFGAIADLASGVLLVETAGHSAGGLMLDLWHVARGNIDLADVAALPLRYMFAVELDDADRSVVGTMLEDTLDRRRLCGGSRSSEPSAPPDSTGLGGSRSYRTNIASGVSMTRLRSLTRLRSASSNLQTQAIECAMRARPFVQQRRR